MIKIIKKFKLPILIFSIYGILSISSPETANKSFDVLLEYLREMIFIIPPIFILMGLMEVWIPKNKIETLLGKESGIKGIIISFMLGTLPTGPLYVAFPMTASLLKKGASVSNMIVFLGSWATLKAPQLLVEAEFLGVPFMILRFVLTFIMLVLMGAFMQISLKLSPDKKFMESNSDNNQIL
ncbi:MAG: permease [Bacillota bacterium]|nr:permease [Bacillota bacterium]